MAQGRTVQVRLFWLHPPNKIHMVPQRASLRSCGRVVQSPLITAIESPPHGSRVTAGMHSSSIVVLNGRSHISGYSFPGFEIENELRVQSRGRISITNTRDALWSNTLPRYLQGESAGFKSDEALKAMAVAARTYAVISVLDTGLRASTFATPRIARICDSETNLPGQERQSRSRKVNCCGSTVGPRRRTITAVAAAR